MTRITSAPVAPVPPELLPTLYRHIRSSGPQPFWLDSGATATPHARWWAMGAGPREVVRGGDRDLPRFFDGLVTRAEAASGPPAPLWVGFLAYEAGSLFEPALPLAPRDPLGLPLAWWARYPAVVVGEVGGGRCWVAGDDPPAMARLGRLVAAAVAGGVAIERREPLLDGLDAAAPDPVVEAGILRVLRGIREGELYQANVTRRFVGRLAEGVEPAELLVRGRSVGPVPYAAHLATGEHEVVSLSPECFLRVDLAARTVETWPIKGTRPRGADATDDERLARELSSDTKELAEHVMIVDLERNDLGRICEAGSVHVPERWPVVRLPGLLHLVSVVRGRLAAGVGLGGVLRATHPSGSITGAPKIRACQVIAEVEGERRGVYCGALGFVDPRGRMCLSVPIRTGVVKDGTLHVHAGGGIVADSMPEREIAEGRLKLATWRALARSL